MGGSPAIRKIVKAVVNPVSAVTTQASKETARKAKVDAVIPGTEQLLDITSGPAGATFVAQDFQKKKEAEKSEAEKIAAETAAAQRKQLSDIKKRKKQEQASSEAGEDLLRARARQSRRSRGTGRSSTILSSKLGGTEGSAGRKSLLGL